MFAWVSVCMVSHMGQSLLTVLLFCGSFLGGGSYRCVALDLAGGWLSWTGSSAAGG